MRALEKSAALLTPRGNITGTEVMLSPLQPQPRNTKNSTRACGRGEKSSSLQGTVVLAVLDALFL